MASPKRVEGSKSLIRKASKLAFEAQTVVSFANVARDMYRARTRWTVTVRSDDRLFPIVQGWLSSDEAGSKVAVRNVHARIGRPVLHGQTSNDFGGRFTDDPRRPKSELAIFSNDRHDRQISLDGHRVTVSRYIPSREVPPGSMPMPEPEEMQFHARSLEGRNAVLALLDRLGSDESRRRPGLMMMSSWGEWNRRDDLPERPLESVVLAEGKMERLRDDIAEFLASETEYVRRGIPYHRGIILHGIPGGGKTSVVRALAAHFGLDLWYAALGDLQKDTSLISMVNQINPRSILLLEDVDVFHAAKDRDDTVGGATIAGLLNALDGVATPHGLITIMTTNDLDALDPALIRPGRMDLIEELGEVTPEQVVRLFEQFYPSYPLAVRNVRYTGSPAGVMEIFKRNMNDPAGARADLNVQRPIKLRKVK